VEVGPPQPRWGKDVITEMTKKGGEKETRSRIRRAMLSQSNVGKRRPIHGIISPRRRKAVEEGEGEGIKKDSRRKGRGEFIL